MSPCPAADLHFLRFTGNEGATKGGKGIPLQNALGQGFFLFLEYFIQIRIKEKTLKSVKQW